MGVDVKVRFYVTASGRSPVEEFLAAQSFEIRVTFVEAVAMLSGGAVLSMPLSRSLSGIRHGLFELRLKDRGGHVRVMYYVKKGDAIYMLHAFGKKTRKLRKREIEVALRRLREV